MQRKFKTLALLTIALILSSTIIHAQSGTLNTAFGDNGLVKHRFLPGANAYSETSTGVVHLNDGKSVVSIVANGRTLLTRMNPDGSIDQSFGKHGYSEVIRTSAITLGSASDGSFYISGVPFTVAHILADGRLDREFGVNGMTAQLFTTGVMAPTMTIQEDGKIVLAGAVQVNLNNWNIAVARFNTDGRLDASFGTEGKVVTDFGFLDQTTSVAIQPDGKIVVGALSGIAINFTVPSVIRYNSDGQLDLLFGKGGRVTTPIATNQPAVVKVQPDGKILLAGSSNMFHLFRFQYDGSPDVAFAHNGMATDGFFPTVSHVRAMELLPGGRILLAGDVYTNPLTNKREIGLVEFDFYGTAYQPFGYFGKSMVTFGPNLNSVRAMKVRDDGRIMIVGSLQPVNGLISDYGIVQCTPQGFLDFGFGNGGQIVRFIEGEVANFRAIALQSDEKIIAGGQVTINNESEFALTRYHTNGLVDESFGANGSVISNVALAEGISVLQLFPDGRILAGGNGRTGNNPFDLVFAVYNTDGSPDLSFGQGGKSIFPIATSNEALNALAIQPDGKFLAGGVTSSPLGSLYILARFNWDGTLDKGFGQNGTVISNFGYASAILNGIELLADGRILTLGRGIHPPNKGTDIILAQYNTDGLPDASFGNGGISITNVTLNDVGQQLKVEADGKITVAGATDAVGNNSDLTIFRYNPDGTPDIFFADGGKATAISTTHDITESFVIQADGKYLLTGQTVSSAGNNLLLARFNRDGSIDYSFGINGRISANVDGEELFNRSVILGENIYLAGVINEVGTTASIISYVLKTPVQLTCPSDMITHTDEGVCGAVVKNIDPIITPVGYHHVIDYRLVGETNGADTGSVSGMHFNKGVTTVTYALANEPSKTCSFNVTVNDTTHPVITVTNMSSAALWPVNHKMRDIELIYEMSDNCGVADSSITITSNELNSGEPDWEIVNSRFIRLRAERDGTGDGRIYTITITAKDGSGNTTAKTILITVPKNQASTVLQNQELRTQPSDLGSTNTALQVKLLSNPTTTYFNLQVSGVQPGRKVTMSIMNSRGMIIGKRENVNSGETVSFGAGYKAGVYFVEVVSGNERKQFRILKQ